MKFVPNFGGRWTATGKKLRSLYDGGLTNIVLVINLLLFVVKYKSVFFGALATSSAEMLLNPNFS